jgi:hypothetical protein
MVITRSSGYNLATERLDTRSFVSFHRRKISKRREEADDVTAEWAPADHNLPLGTPCGVCNSSNRREREMHRVSVGFSFFAWYLGW